MSVRRVALMGGIVLAAVALVLEISPSIGDSLPGGVEPLPEPIRADFKTAETARGTKYWPRSASIEEGVEYRFNTGHCGLDFMTDFDASFWTPEKDSTPPDFYMNEDTGTMELVSEDESLYRSSNGQTVSLARHRGPLVTEGGCA